VLGCHPTACQAFWFLRLLPEPNLISPGQLDIIEGRKSMLDWHFAELVQVGLCFDACP
jgi:hypothetical protein